MTKKKNRYVVLPVIFDRELRCYAPFPEGCGKDAREASMQLNSIQDSETLASRLSWLRGFGWREKATPPTRRFP